MACRLSKISLSKHSVISNIRIPHSSATFLTLGLAALIPFSHKGLSTLIILFAVNNDGLTFFKYASNALTANSSAAGVFSSK